MRFNAITAHPLPFLDTILLSEGREENAAPSFWVQKTVDDGLRQRIKHPDSSAWHVPTESLAIMTLRTVSRRAPVRMGRRTGAADPCPQTL